MIAGEHITVSHDQTWNWTHLKQHSDIYRQGDTDVLRPSGRCHVSHEVSRGRHPIHRRYPVHGSHPVHRRHVITLAVMSRLVVTSHETGRERIMRGDARFTGYIPQCNTIIVQSALVIKRLVITKCWASGSKIFHWLMTINLYNVVDMRMLRWTVVLQLFTNKIKEWKN